MFGRINDSLEQASQPKTYGHYFRRRLHTLSNVAAVSCRERWLQVMYHSLSLVIPDDGATDEALQALMEIAKQHPDSVPLALAIATGYVKLGNIPRARTHLKRAQVRPLSPCRHQPALAGPACTASAKRA